jgi:hypothetical protein
MKKIEELFKILTSHGEITIVQKGFLYGPRVDTRERELVLKDFITLAWHLLRKNYLQISFTIKGQRNALQVPEDIKKVGISVEVLRNELNWIIELDEYEVDALLHLNLPEETVEELLEQFYQLPDAVMVYPTGHMSWQTYLEKNP